jgi:hypothetical protein
MKDLERGEKCRKRYIDSGQSYRQCMRSGELDRTNYSRVVNLKPLSICSMRLTEIQLIHITTPVVQSVEMIEALIIGKGSKVAQELTQN